MQRAQNSTNWLRRPTPIEHSKSNNSISILKGGVMAYTSRYQKMEIEQSVRERRLGLFASFRFFIYLQFLFLDITVFMLASGPLHGPSEAFRRLRQRVNDVKTQQRENIAIEGVCVKIPDQSVNFYINRHLNFKKVSFSKPTQS